MGHRLHWCAPEPSEYRSVIEAIPLTRLIQVTQEINNDPSTEQMVRDIWQWAVAGDLTEQMVSRLTHRQTQIMELMSSAKHDGSNKVIGRALGISDRTVKAHFREICVKHNLMSRAQAVAWYLRAVSDNTPDPQILLATHPPQSGSTSHHRRGRG